MHLWSLRSLFHLLSHNIAVRRVLLNNTSMLPSIWKASRISRWWSPISTDPTGERNCCQNGHSNYPTNELSLYLRYEAFCLLFFIPTLLSMLILWSLHFNLLIPPAPHASISNSGLLTSRWEWKPFHHSASWIVRACSHLNSPLKWLMFDLWGLSSRKRLVTAQMPQLRNNRNFCSLARSSKGPIGNFIWSNPFKRIISYLRNDSALIHGTRMHTRSIMKLYRDTPGKK